MMDMSVYLETFAHATENLSKVLEALQNLLPQSLRGRVNPVIETVKGHYDNEIAILRLELRDRDAELFIKELSSKLNDEDKRELAYSLDLRVDGSSLYLRLDKGQAYLGRARLTLRGEAIKVKLTPTIPKGSSLKEYLRKVGLLNV
ncbi:MAG: hypothetical protein DRJ97_00305 [Thermoprotei archaeon]|nr:MAG: hypothetical protein DRJ97_00305 [Thermoprotei archaeon]